MSNIYSLKIVKNGVAIQRKQIATGLSKTGAPLTLKADADLTYVLQDEGGGKPLAKIKTHFEGRDLHVVIDTTDEQNTHLVLQNYADVQNSSAIATSSRLGELVVFKADTAASAGGMEGVTTWVAPGIDDGSSVSMSSPVVWVGGALALAAVSHGSASSGSSSTTSASASDTALSKINTYINAIAPTAASTPMLKDYTDAGITGIVDSTMAAAVNSALKPLGTTTVGDAQQVVNAYLKVWNKANGAAPDTTINDPTAADYQKLGVTPLPTGNGLALLNDIVKTHLTTDVNTITALNNYAKVANNIMLAAADNSVTLPVTDLNSIGLTDITAGNVAAFLSAITASANEGTSVSSIAQLKAISASYIKILAEADGIKGNTTDPSKLATKDDFQKIGAKIGKAGDSTNAQSGAALNLLNDVIDGSANTAVDTVKEITDLAAIVDKIMNLTIAGTTLDGTLVGLKVSDLVALGVTGVTADNLAQVVEAIRLTQSGNGSAVDTVKELQAAADLGANLSVIMNYANTDPGTSAHVAPTLNNYINAGVLSADNGAHKAINSGNLAAINSAVEALAGADVNNASKLQVMVNAYSKILAEADGIKGNTTDPSKLATKDDFQKIGATIGKAGDSTNAQSGAALNLLNDVIDGSATTSVDTVKEITDLAAIVDKVMTLSTSTAGQGSGVGLKLTDLSALGVTGVTADNLAQVVEAIRLTQSANGTAVDTVKELQSAADLGVIMNYANTDPGTSAHVAPTLNNYINAGVLSADNGAHKAINSGNLASVNSAVDALTATEANNAAKLQAVVNAYSKVLAEADGTKANTLEANKLSVADLQALGALRAYDAQTGAIGGTVTGKALGPAGQGQQAAALKLLNDVIDGRSATQVDTIAELNQLNIVVDKVMDVANGSASALTATDFAYIGINGVTSANLTKVVANIAATHADSAHGSDGTLVDTLPELQALASFAVVQTYSLDPSVAPSAQTYSADLGFTDITLNANLATAVNSVLVAKHNGSITLNEVHNLALDFQSILNEATSGVTNNNPNPTAAQYEDVLLNLGHVFHGGVLNTTTDIHSNALALLNDVVMHKSQSGVDTLGEVDALATVVDHIMNKAVDPSGTASGNVTLAELTSLGLVTNGWSDSANPNKTIAINNAIRATDDSGVGVHTWDQLQAILNSSAVFQA